MYQVSNEWAEAHSELLAPEGFVELSCYIPELDETLVYTKKDLLSFTHQQTGSVVSGELPKNHIEFSLDNSDGKWDPNSPRGLERYLSERLRITLRYGFNLDGATEWIPGGVFYLSEWNTSANGLSASFMARDLLEYMIDTPYTGKIDGTLYEVAQRAIAAASIPADAVVRISEDLANYPVNQADYNGSQSVAEILQKCANAAGCVMYQDRDGVFIIGKLDRADTEFTVSLNLSYSYPQIELAKPLRNVSIKYAGGVEYRYGCNIAGETQTLDNDFIATEGQAAIVAEWIAKNLQIRKKISGEFRCDPRFDLFDVIRVESKYGVVCGAVITDIKYTFNGAFHGVYSGYVRGVVSDAAYCGDVFSGEVI